MRRALLVATSFMIACQVRGELATSPAPHGGGPLDDGVHACRAVLALEVDQLAAWVAEERIRDLPKGGGFARLRREGAWVSALELRHAVTVTAAGHASLHTGVVPAAHGIAANELIAANGEVVSIFRDEETKLVGPDGPLEGRAGSSPRALRSKTVAERFVATHPSAFVLSASWKDRAAIAPVGAATPHVYWFDATSGSFVTSTAFRSAMPAWARRAGGRDAVAKAVGQPWAPDAASEPLLAHARHRSAEGKGDDHGFGVSFPHVPRDTRSLRATPAADALLVDMALAGLDAECRGEALVHLSFSANDYVGHLFGPDAPEAVEILARLDASLARLFEGLDARGILWSAVLSADHGVATMPEARALRPECAAVARHARADRWERPCDGGVRLRPDELADELRRASVSALGPGAWVRGVVEPWIVLSDEARALDPSRRALLDAVVHRALERHADSIERIEGDGFHRRCLAAPPEPGSTDALICASWPAPAPGDYYVLVRHGSVFDPDIVRGRGASHGTPYRHDRLVPLFVRAPRRVEDGLLVTSVAPFTRYAESLAALLGVPGAAIPEELVVRRPASP